MTNKDGGPAEHHQTAGPAPKTAAATKQHLDLGEQRTAARRERRARDLARRRVNEYRDRHGAGPVGRSASAGWLDRRATATRRLPPLDPPLVPEPRGPGWLSRVDPWAAQYDRSRGCPSCGCCPGTGRGGGAA